MNSLRFLGTGPGYPVPGRFCSSSVLHSGPATYLIDAGEPCSQRLRELGIAFGSIDAVFLTHAHSDHVGGFSMFIQSNWLEGRRHPLPVYLPRELAGPVRAWLDAVLLPANLVGFELPLIPWEPGKPVVLREGTVETFETTHLHGLRQRIDPAAADRFHAHGLCLRAGGRRVIVSSDIGSPRDLLPALDEPADLLVCELAHFEPEALFDVLAGRAVRHLWLTHIAPELAPEAGAIAERARAALPQIDEIAIAEDGALVTF